MHWKRYVRRKLLAYNAFRADRDELLEMAAGMDEDIKPKMSRLTGMPRGKGGQPHSIVEQQVLDREESFDGMTMSLEQLEQQIAPIEKALMWLDYEEEALIRFTFHSVQGNEEEYTWHFLLMTPEEAEKTKHEAMWKIYCFLQSDCEDAGL